MFRSLMVVVVALALVGCSLVNPYVIDRGVREGRPPGEPIRDAAVVNPSQMTFEEASAYAARVKQRYRDALGDQAKLQNWLGIGLVPLSAAAMGLGVSGGHTKDILALGLAGAAGFGTVTWLSNRPRSAAYAAGIKAVTCAEQAVTPLALPELVPEGRFDGQLKNLSEWIRVVTKDIPAVQASIERLERELGTLTVADRAPFTPLVDEARQEVTQARSLVASADAAYLTGSSLSQTVSGLGRRLAVVIDAIVATVDGLITDTQRDPQALATIVGSLGGAYGVLTTVPDPIKSTAAKKNGAAQGLTEDATRDRKAAAQVPEVVRQLHEQLISDLTKLRSDSASLDAARVEVVAVIKSVSKDDALKALEGCGVKPGDVVTALVIDPAGPLPLPKSGTTGFTVRGGVPPYIATIAGPSNGVTLSLAGTFSAYNVTASKDAASGTYVVTVSDSTLKESKRVEVEVPAATGAGAPPGTGDPPSGGNQKLNAVFAEFSKLVKDKPFGIDGTDFKLKATDVQQPAPGKAKVTVTIEKTDPAKLGNLTHANLIGALIKLGEDSGMKRTDVEVIEFDALKAKAAEMAKASAPPKAAATMPADCDKIVREPNVPADSEPSFSGTQATRERIQAALCFKPKPDKPGERIDGVWGPYTKMKLSQYQCRTGRKPDGKLTDELKKELLSLSGEQLAEQCR